MVGSSSYLVACCLLVPEYFYPDGQYNYRCSYDDCVWYISVDTDRICATPILVPHKNQKLLGKHSALSSSWMPSQASDGWTSTCLSTSCRSYFVLSVLEHDQAIFDPVYNTWPVWRWPAGLRDLWLHTLLPASWPAIIRSCKISQEVPSQPSLQNSNQGLWNNFDPVGSCIWHAAFYQNCRQEHLILTGSSALQNLSEIIHDWWRFCWINCYPVSDSNPWTNCECDHQLLARRCDWRSCPIHGPSKSSFVSSPVHQRSFRLC